MQIKQILPLLLLLAITTACNPQKKLLESGNATIEKVNGTHIQCANNISTSIDALADEDYTIFYLVRHAEKQKSGNDPGLLPEGTQRAKRLADILADTKIDMVCSSPYKRTQATASPTAESKNLKITNYSQRQNDQSAFFTDLINNHPGSRVLVVGHSNTIPKLLNHFKGSDVYSDIDESIYDHFFIVAVKNEQAEINRFKY